MRPGHSLTRRLFIAFRLPAPVVDAVTRWQQETLACVPHIRLTAPAQLHVTAVFLGATPDAEVQTVIRIARQAMRHARRPIFRVDSYRENSRVGMLTLREEPAAGAAAELTGQLMLALETAGRYARESRDWRPHVTVGRFRTPPRLRLSPPPVAPFAAADLALYESTSSPAGSTYATLEAFPFRDGPPAA